MQSVANMVRELGSRNHFFLPQITQIKAQKTQSDPDRSDQEKNVGADNFDIAFKIFTSNKDLDGAVLQNIEFDKWVHYSENTEVWYSSDNNLLPVLKKEISKESPAYLFIVGIYSWQFNFKPLLFCKGVKKIISVRGMLHPGALSQKSFKKKIYLSIWKLLGLQRKNIFHATDEQEKEYIQQVFGTGVTIKVAANFPGVLKQQPVVEKTAGSLKLVSIGLISPMKNILKVLEVLQLGVGSLEFGVKESGVGSQESGLPSVALAKEGVGSGEEGGGSRESGVGSGKSGLRPPLVRGRQAQGLEYNIYGPIKDKSYWEECEQLIKKMPATIKVKYHGDVQPKNIEQVLAQNHIFILPSKSENFGHAIYEALTAGRPVITSNHTPWNNLQDSKAGINVSTENTNELRSAIDFFAAMNQEQLQEWSDGAREYALKAVDMERTRREYEEMWK